MVLLGILLVALVVDLLNGVFIGEVALDSNMTSIDDKVRALGDRDTV